MDRLEAMSLLVTVSEEGTLSAASRRLGKPLPTVHRHIGDLESQLGSRLLNRTTRRTELTEVGVAYVAACRRILEQVEDAERTARGEYGAPRGELVMTAPIVFGRLHVTPLLIDFLATYPQINVRLMLVDRIAHLMEEHIDIALRIGELEDSSMIALPLGQIRRVCCASPRYLEVSGRPAHPGELAHHQCIAMGAPNERQVWSFVDQHQALHQAIQPRLTITTAEGTITAAERGGGIIRALSYQVAEAIRDWRLETVLEPFEPPAWPANLVYRSQSPMPRKTRVLIDFLKSRLRERLGADAA